MESNSIATELDDILNDLNKINILVSEKEKDLASVREIYITQDGTESYILTIDKNTFPIHKSELKTLVAQLYELGIEPEFDNF